MENKNKTITGKPTQGFLKFSEIKEDALIMDNGTLRAIVSVSSTNFDLKSQDEQNAIIMSFQNFLNSLEFPIQILMQSRKMDVAAYLEKLKKMEERQANELLKVQTTEYINFIKQLVESASIMDKQFYIIIPLDKSVKQAKPGLLSSLFGGGAGKETAQKLEIFRKNKTELDNRVNSVMSNLGGLGVKGARLNTSQIIKLMYDSYNFDSGPSVDPEKLGEIKVIEN